MGIFTKFRDIVNANLNAMLEKAEDPEKLLQSMLFEMDETLIALKTSCAGVIAEKHKLARRRQTLDYKKTHWEKRAQLAVAKGREELAREALREKLHFGRSIDTIAREMAELQGLVDRYRQDIALLEDKRSGAREKQRLLVQREIRARQAIRAREEMQKLDTFETIARFEELEERIEQMEAEADLVNFGCKPSLEEKFEMLAIEERLENELAALRGAARPGA